MLLGTITGLTGVYASLRGLVLAFSGESTIDRSLTFPRSSIINGLGYSKT